MAVLSGEISIKSAILPCSSSSSSSSSSSVFVQQQQSRNLRCWPSNVHGTNLCHQSAAYFAISRPLVSGRVKFPASFDGFKNKLGQCLAARNGGQPASEEDKPEDKTNSGSSETSGEEETGSNDKIHATDLDWRSFRARLVASEQVQTASSMDVKTGKVSLGHKWAHPIFVPESGSLLIANVKLDESNFFERTVVLLLKAGSNDFNRPYGIILNRPLKKRVEDLKLSHPDLATIFADCSLHFGGPVTGSMFLVSTEKKLKDFEQVFPGLYIGQVNSLHRAAELVKSNILQPSNFRFFLGYSCWDTEQLKEEVALDYWHIAACSPSVVTAASASNRGLWKEVLQLMGGQYAELSREPKDDSL